MSATVTAVSEVGEEVIDGVLRNWFGQGRDMANAGYGDAFVHRTGHSIDIDLHGSGPHLDNFETNDVREIVPELGFSVEPGIYLEGRFGVRTEVNVVQHESGPEVTPNDRQRELILAT